MRRFCLALIAGLVVTCALASAAAADGLSPGAPPIQAAGQVATSEQSADSSATSAQIAPKNTNVDVRVLSPGNNGPVSQANTSTAAAIAANGNSTDQDTTQSGDGGLQQAGQIASNLQDASATADSTQVKPENTNVGVRVLSPGDDGSVEQTNASTALALAANKNQTDQDVTQAAEGPAAQTAAQTALSKQGAAADATSKQIAPKNTNVGVRVLSPGNNGDVTQRNDSTAKAIAANLNSTDQDASQAADGHGSSQTAGQIAGNVQDADASALSAQIAPRNTNADVRVLSPGHGGDVTQANTSTAVGVALNANKTDQDIRQESSGGDDDKCCGHKDGVAVQAAGQLAGNIQSATVCCAASIQVHPENSNLSTDGPSSPTRQENTSTAVGVAANLNDLDQDIVQDPADDPKAAPTTGTVEGTTEGLAEALAAPSAGTDQSNESKALAVALNKNETDQDIVQRQSGPPSDVAVQAAGQIAGNEQSADSSALSIQYGAENRNGSFGSKGDWCRERCDDDHGSIPLPCGYDRCKPDKGDTRKCGEWDRCPKPQPKWCGYDRISPSPCRHGIRDEVVPLEG
jgi:hypothetical protein